MYLISETWLHLPPSLSSPIFNQCHVNISPFLCFPPSPALRADDRKPWNPPVAPNSAPNEPLSSACTSSHQVRAFGLMNDHQWRNRHRLAYVRAALQPNEGHVMAVQPISHPSLTAQRVMGRPADPFQYLLMSNGTQAGHESTWIVKFHFLSRRCKLVSYVSIFESKETAQRGCQCLLNYNRWSCFVFSSLRFVLFNLVK